VGILNILLIVVFGWPHAPVGRHKCLTPAEICRQGSVRILALVFACGKAGICFGAVESDSYTLQTRVGRTNVEYLLPMD